MLMRPPVLPYANNSVNTSSLSNSSNSSGSSKASTTSSLSSSAQYQYQQQYPQYQVHRVSTMPMAPSPTSQTSSSFFSSSPSGSIQSPPSVASPPVYMQHNSQQQHSFQPSVPYQQFQRSMSEGSGIYGDDVSIYSGINSKNGSEKSKFRVIQFIFLMLIPLLLESVRFQDMDIFLSEAREKARDGRVLPGRSKTKQRLSLPDYDHLVSVYQQADPSIISFLHEPIQYLPLDYYDDIEEGADGDEEKTIGSSSIDDADLTDQSEDDELCVRENESTRSHNSGDGGVALKGKARVQAMMASRKAMKNAMMTPGNRDSASSASTTGGTTSMSSLSASFDSAQQQDGPGISVESPSTGGGFNMLSRAKALVRRVSIGSTGSASTSSTIGNSPRTSSPSKRMVPVRMGSKGSAQVEDEKEDDHHVIRRSNSESEAPIMLAKRSSSTSALSSTKNRVIVPVRAGSVSSLPANNDVQQQAMLTSSSSWSSASSPETFPTAANSSQSRSIPPAKPPKPTLSRLVPVDSCDHLVELNNSIINNQPVASQPAIDPDDAFFVGGGREFDSSVPEIPSGIDHTGGLQQYVPYPLSEEEAVCLMMLISDQEAKYGIHMFEAMSDFDKEQATILAQEMGIKYEDAVLQIFEIKFGITHSQSGSISQSRSLDDQTSTTPCYPPLPGSISHSRSLDDQVSTTPCYPPPPVPTSAPYMVPTSNASVVSHGTGSVGSGSSSGSSKPPTPSHRRNSAGIPKFSSGSSVVSCNNSVVSSLAGSVSTKASSASRGVTFADYPPPGVKTSNPSRFAVAGSNGGIFTMPSSSSSVVSSSSTTSVLTSAQSMMSATVNTGTTSMMTNTSATTSASNGTSYAAAPSVSNYSRDSGYTSGEASAGSNSQVQSFMQRALARSQTGNLQQTPRNSSVPLPPPILIPAAGSNSNLTTPASIGNAPSSNNNQIAAQSPYFYQSSSSFGVPTPTSVSVMSADSGGSGTSSGTSPRPRHRRSNLSAHSDMLNMVLEDTNNNAIAESVATQPVIYSQTLRDQQQALLVQQQQVQQTPIQYQSQQQVQYQMSTGQYSYPNNSSNRVVLTQQQPQPQSPPQQQYSYQQSQPMNQIMVSMNPMHFYRQF